MLLALAGSTALAPCSFPAPLTFLAVQDVGPQPRVAGARPRVPKPVPGTGVSVPSPWPGEQRGSAAPHGLLGLGFSLGHPAAQAPQNPRTLGQEGPQEGAQSFRTSSLEPAGSSQAEPGHPLIREGGAPGSPAPKKGGWVLRMEALWAELNPKEPQNKGNGQGGPVVWLDKRPPCVSPNPPQGRRGHLDTWRAECHSADSLVLLLPLPPPPLQDQLRL